MTFEIEDAGHGAVKLTVVHDGFEPESADLKRISEGWPAVLSSLKPSLRLVRRCGPRKFRRRFHFTARVRMQGTVLYQFVGTEISPATEGPIDRSLLAAFIELIQRQRVGRVADIGCGPVRVAASLVERGLDVVGVDVSQAMLTAARTAHPHIEFEEGRLDALPIETGCSRACAGTRSSTHLRIGSPRQSAN